jgi:hypothetical protein
MMGVASAAVSSASAGAELVSDEKVEKPELTATTGNPNAVSATANPSETRVRLMYLSS